MPRQVQRPGAHEHGDDDEADRDLVGDHLGRRAQRAEERVFRVRGPAAHDDAVDAERRDREDVEDADIDVGDGPAGIERDHRPGGERERADHQRREQEHALVGGAGITGSFRTNFSRSAKDCSSPQGPTTFGPRRSCTAAQILRSA